MIIVPPPWHAEREAVAVLPIWQECSRCLRLGRCEDPFAPSGICLHPDDHIVATGDHPILRRPRYWDAYQECLQTDFELGSIFQRWSIGAAMSEADFLKMREKSIAYGCGVTSGPRWLIWEMVDEMARQLHGDFCTYYIANKVFVATRVPHRQHP